MEKKKPREKGRRPGYPHEYVCMLESAQKHIHKRPLFSTWGGSNISDCDFVYRKSFIMHV